jgi:hypothetical protein
MRLGGRITPEPKVYATGITEVSGANAAALTRDALEPAISNSVKGGILRNGPYSYGRNTPRLRTVRRYITYGRTGALSGHSAGADKLSAFGPERPLSYRKSSVALDRALGRRGPK